jgi:hypothetical protein
MFSSQNKKLLKMTINTYNFFYWIHHGRDEKEMESTIYRTNNINEKHELLKIV